MSFRACIAGILIVFVAQIAGAHQQQQAYINLLFNERNGRLEISHRFSLHDASHVAGFLGAKKADIIREPKTRELFANYIGDNFELQDSQQEPYTLTTIGHEIDGKYFWFYQDMDIPQDSELRVKHTALQEFWSAQINQINVTKGAIVRSVNIGKDKEWYTIILPADGPKSRFFATLIALCGESFSGVMTDALQSPNKTVDKPMMVTIKHCNEKEIFVSVNVDGTPYRVVVSKQDANNLELKHGYPDSASQGSSYVNKSVEKVYVATDDGTNLTQSFRTDTHANFIPAETATDVWKLSLSADRMRLICYLSRHGKLRLTAVMQRS